MIKFFEYIFKGTLHYINLMLGLLDFKDLGFMWVIIIWAIRRNRKNSW